MVVQLKMNKWTDKQEQAITAKNCSVIVSAAAGSGKTSVLVERLIRQLVSTESKIPADRMVVVTFTNDAAAEMKQRLSSALSEKLRENPENTWINKQNILLQSAHISTIHSFCFDLIRENIEKFDISYGFRIMDETEYKVLLSEQIKETFEFFYENRVSEMNQIVDFFCIKSDKKLEEIILNIFAYIESIPFYEIWLDDIKNGYINCETDRIKQLMKSYSRYIDYKISDIIHDAELCSKMAEEIYAEKAFSLIDNERKIFINNKNFLFSNDDWDKKAEIFTNVSFERISFPKYEKGSCEYETADRIKKIRDGYKKKYNSLVTQEIFTSDQIASDISVHYNIISLLIDILTSFIKNVKLKKTEKNAISFSDAEQMALKLVGDIDKYGKINKTSLAESLSEYYKIIMIDEYQDSNDIQDLIFKMLSHNGTEKHNGDNLFVVGDIKQSIYRFRHANPKIFINTLKDANPYSNQFTEKNASVTLNKNFRSSSEVINFVNFVFSNVMSRAVGDVEYNENEALIPGSPENSKTDSITEISFIKKDKNIDENYDDVTEEAKYVASKINSMISGGTFVNDKGNIRPCKSSDFCILVRNKKSALPFVKILSEYGIASHTDDISGYLKSREISVLINILRVISNPLQDIALAAVLMSPMYSMTAEEMSEIRLNQPNGYLYNALCKTLEKEDATESLCYQKCKKFYKDNNLLRMYSAGVSLEKLVRYIYEDTDFMTVIQLYRDGEQKRANLRLLLEYVKSYENSANGGLTGFIRYIDTISKNGGDLKQAGTAFGTDNVVQIKTMHKSKGLEFPFVFICKTSVQFNKTDLSSQILYNTEQGIGLKIQNKKTLSKYITMPFLTIREQNKRDLMSEELRLLYVALTRAKQKLFITFEYNDKYIDRMSELSDLIENNNGKLSQHISSKAQCMQDWIAMTLLLCKDSKEIFDELGVNTVNAVLDFPKLNIISYSDDNSVSDYNLSNSNGSSKSSESNIDKAILNKIKVYTDYVYDTSQTFLPSKLTVSEISKKCNDIILNSPSFMNQNAGGAEKGTAIHTFMQHADYTLAEKNAEKEASRLYKKGKLTKRQFEILEMSSIENFFNSELYLIFMKPNKIYREQKFLIKLEDLYNCEKIDADLGEFLKNYIDTDGMLQGVADCVIENDASITIVDYKTDRVNSEETLRQQYIEQIKLYSVAFEKIYKKPVDSTILYSFYHNKHIICK